MKLKNLLVTAFILISVIPIFFSLQYVNNYTSKQYRQQIEDKLSALSLIAKKRIQDVLARIEDNANLIASRTQMRISLAKWNQTQEARHAEKITRIIRDASAGMERLHDISIYDTKGKLVASTGVGESAKLLSSRPREITKTDLVRKDDQLYIINITRLTLDNATIGFIRVDFFADFILDLVNDRSGLGTTGEWLFAVRNDKGDALFAIPLKYDRDAAFKRVVKKERIDIPITQALLGNEIIMNYAPDYMEEPVMASTRYIQEQDWGLVVKIREKEVNSILSESNRLLLWLEIIIIVLSVFLGILFSFYIANPIEKLKKHTHTLAQGDFSVRPVPEGWHEAKELAISFNTMAESLRELNENLNKKVAERTQELDEANQQLKEIAIRDPLTDLYNRRFLIERFEQEFNRARRYETSLAVVMLDIDHFKQINDTWGHAAGDNVLKKIAEFLNESMRDSDILGRLGGEEFCMILPTKNPSSILPVIERLRIGISEINFQLVDKTFNVTCSFGIAVFNKDIKTPDELMDRADKAMYKAKSGGRNRVEQYS